MSDQARRYHRIVGDTEWVYEIGHEGLIGKNLRQGRVYRTPLPLLAILTDPNIAKYLEIDDFQQHELRKQAKALEKACQLADKEYRNADWRDANQREQTTLSILEPAIESSIQTIRDLLVEDQTVRLRQISIQLEISRRGLLWFLESGLGTEIGIMPEQKVQIRKRYLELAENWSIEVQSQRQKTVDLILSAASDSKRKKLTQAMGSQKNLYKTPLKILALQLDENAISAFLAYKIESHWPKYAGISAPFSFQLNSLGEFVRVEPRESPDQFDDRIPDWLVVYCLGNGELELVPEQIKAIQALRSQQLQLWDSQSQAINTYIEAHNIPFPPVEFRQRQQRQRIQFRDQIVPTIENILLPHQQAVLSEFAARNKFTLHGPVVAILTAESSHPARSKTADDDNKTSDVDHDRKQVSGQAKPDLLSKIENQGLRLLAEQQQKKINEQLIAIEQESNRKLLEELAPRQRKNYEAMVGRPLALERGNIEFHLAIAQRPNEVRVSNQEPIWMEEIQVIPKQVKIIAD